MTDNMTDTELTQKALHDRIEEDRNAYAELIPDKGSTLVSATGKIGNASAVKSYRQYAKGVQLCTVASGTLTFLEGTLANQFADNVCHQINAEAADRLQLLRFDVANAEVLKFLREEIWVKNNLSDKSGETHYDTLRDGNFCLLPDWDEEQQRVVIHMEEWWDGDSGAFVGYDEEGNATYAVKEWTDSDKNKRRTVYFDDRIERYISRGGGMAWEPFTLETDTAEKLNQDGSVKWLKNNGKPLHIPLIHFANAGRGAALYGLSELAGGVLGFQDQLNDLQYDISAAARMTAFQMVWATGYKPIVNKDGTVRDFVVAPGAWFATSDPAGAFGVLPAGDLSQLENTYKMKLKAVCRMTRTPLHAIIGEFPSGEALLRAELPAVNKANRQAAKFAAAWATLAHRCVEISNAFGGTSLDENAMITAVFAPTTQLGDLQKAMADREFWTGAKLATETGYSLKMYLEDHGWEPEKIKAFLADKLEDFRYQVESEQLLWDAVASADSAGVPAEVVLKRLKITDVDIASIMAARAAEMAQRQSDIQAVPAVQ